MTCYLIDFVVCFPLTVKKPRILDQDIREIKPEELIYNLPKEPFIKNDNFEIFKGEYNKFTVAIKRYAYSRSTSLRYIAYKTSQSSCNISFGAKHICLMGYVCPTQSGEKHL